MTSNASLYGIGASATPSFNTVVEARNPTSTDVKGPFGPFPLGQLWVNNVGNSAFILTSLTTQGGSLLANWLSV